MAIVIMVLASGGEMFETFEGGFLPGSDLGFLGGGTDLVEIDTGQNATDTTPEPSEEIETEYEIISEPAEWAQDKAPEHYIKRYEQEPLFREWFDVNYLNPGTYSSIYEAVGVEAP